MLPKSISTRWADQETQEENIPTETTNPLVDDDDNNSSSSDNNTGHIEAFQARVNSVEPLYSLNKIAEDVTKNISLFGSAETTRHLLSLHANSKDHEKKKVSTPFVSKLFRLYY